MPTFQRRPRQCSIDRTRQRLLDHELVNIIENEYVQLVEADTQERVQPLAGHLEEQGYVVATLGALPAIAVSLPKTALLELVSRSDVGLWAWMKMR